MIPFAICCLVRGCIEGKKRDKKADLNNRPAFSKRNKNRSWKSGDLGDGLGGLALVVGGAVCRNLASLRSLVDCGGKFVVSNGSSGLVCLFYGSGNLLAKGFQAGLSCAVASRACFRLTNALKC